MSKKININTVKPVYNDHPRDPKIVAVVDRWSLFRGHLCQKKLNLDLKIYYYFLTDVGDFLSTECVTDLS